MPGSIIKALHVLSHVILTESLTGSTIIIYTLQMRNWFRKVKELGQGHTAGKWSSQDMNPNSLTPGCKFLAATKIAVEGGDVQAEVI